jgi:hypothetical protein
MIDYIFIISDFRASIRQGNEDIRNNVKHNVSKSLKGADYESNPVSGDSSPGNRRGCVELDPAPAAGCLKGAVIGGVAG